jgi:hypothetical protein
MIANAQCHVLASWFNSSFINIQPGSRIIHTREMSFNGGAAGIYCEAMQSADITPALTGRGDNADRFKFSIKAALFALRLNELLGSPASDKFQCQ